MGFRSARLLHHSAAPLFQLQPSFFLLPLLEFVLPDVENLQPLCQEQIQSGHGLCVQLGCRSAAHTSEAAMPALIDRHPRETLWGRVKPKPKNSKLNKCLRIFARTTTASRLNLTRFKIAQARLVSKQQKWQCSKATAHAPVENHGNNSRGIRPSCRSLGHMRQAAGCDLPPVLQTPRLTR